MPRRPEQQEQQDPTAREGYASRGLALKPPAAYPPEAAPARKPRREYSDWHSWAVRTTGSLPALRDRTTGAFTAVKDRGRKAPVRAKVIASVLGVVVLAVAGTGCWAYTQLPAGTGTVDNYNPLTGSDGIIGVKTGTDSQAQACWAFAQRQAVGGKSRVVYGVVLGSPLLSTPTDQAKDAISDGVRLASSVPGAFRTVTVVPAGTVVAHIHVPWQTAAVPVVTTTAIAGLAGPGTTVSLSEKTDAPKGAFTRGAKVGQITASGLVSGTTSTALVAQGTAAAPGLDWRIAH